MASELWDQYSSIMKDTEIDFKELVFKAARDGHSAWLKCLLESRSKEEVAEAVSAVTCGSTPLVIACRNGHDKVVEYLIEEHNVNIEQVGSVTFNLETIEDAPPLWCAAAAGHFSLVKILLSYNANINSTTKTQSTAIRAACFDGHYQIVKYLVEHGADIELANRHGHTCLMISCYKGKYQIAEYLISKGADVNRKSSKGNTALHDSAEFGSMEVMQLLLSNGAEMCKDSHSVTPLMAAALTGHAYIVEYLIREPECSVESKVEALELLGAAYIDKKRDILCALDCWRRAMLMRYQDVNKPIIKDIDKSPISAVVNATEALTYSDLEALGCDPDAMRMQALLIRERILGTSHPDTAYYIRFRGASYADIGHFERCIPLWMYAVDIQQRVLEPLSPMTQTSVLSFAELFSCMMCESVGDYIVSFRDVVEVYYRALKEITNAMQRVPYPTDDLAAAKLFHRLMMITMYLVGLMCLLQKQMTKHEEFEMKQAVYKLVQMNPKGRDSWTLLHIACYHDPAPVNRYPIFHFPSLDVVELLLEVGACPNVADSDNNTPLHVAAMNEPCPQSIFKTLLTHGAHIDLCNRYKKTALELCRSTVLDICPLQHVNLQCLTAQVIRSNHIQFKGKVPKILEDFILAH